MNTSVLIYSCDKYSDVWGPFFTLFFRYWNCPYQVYLTAETEQCLIPEVKTINTDGAWTDRIRQAVEEIPTDYIIGMCEDHFIRRAVRQGIIEKCEEYMDKNENIACFNFEKEYDWTNPSDYPGFGRKPNGSSYRKSCQPTMWRRKILLELLADSANPWMWELSPAPDDYEYYIWTGPEEELVFEYGYHNNNWCGIMKGRWVAHDVIPLFKKEGIDIDYTIRGIV